MWRVEGPKGSAILFGSFHLLPPGVQWRTPALERAVADADELWFEIPLGAEANAKAGEALRRAGRLPPGQSLAGQLTPAEAERLSRAAQAVGLDPAQLARQRPWMADLLLSAAAAMRMAPRPVTGWRRASTPWLQRPSDAARWRPCRAR